MVVGTLALLSLLSMVVSVNRAGALKGDDVQQNTGDLSVYVYVRMHICLSLKKLAEAFQRLAVVLKRSAEALWRLIEAPLGLAET